MKELTTIFAALVLVAAPVQASKGKVQQNPPVTAADCTYVHNTAERLACYDAALGYAEPSELVANGGWILVSDRDAFTGRDTSFVMLESDKNDPRFSDAPSSLVARCDGNGGHEIYVATDAYIGSRNERIPVRYMFDTDEPIKEVWNESTKGTAAFLPTNYNDFRTGIQSADQVVFEITDCDYSSP